ncbi:MAG: AI-2E family transporter, partial [Dermatophilaceae bacterium]
RTASEWAWRALLVAAAGYVVVYLLGLLSEVVIPVVVALLLAALLQPIYQALARVLPRALAALVTVIGTIGGVLGLLSFVGSQLVDQLDDITAQVGQGIDQVRAWASTTFGITDSQVDEWVDRARTAISAANLTDLATAAGVTAGHAITGFFLAVFTLFFFLYDGPTIWTWAVRLFPRAARDRVDGSGAIAWAQLSAYTRATVLVAAADAVGIGIGAALLGLPFASGVALIVFFGAFVPIVGALLSGSVAVLLALVALGPVEALGMLGIVILVQQIESHLLQPLLIGRAMRIHPLAIILAIATGIVLAGIVGGLIAVPLVAVLNAVGHYLVDEPPTRDDAATEERFTTADDRSVDEPRPTAEGNQPSG